MSDLEKINFILKTLNENQLKLKGVADAAHLVQSYNFLLKIKRQLESKQQEPQDVN